MNSLITFVTIGYGTVAPLHHSKFLEYAGAKPVGIIESDSSKQMKIKEKGLHLCQSYEEALSLKPTFWDVCTPNETHLQVLEKIMQIDPTSYILVEKPICSAAEIPRLRNLLQNFKGKIVVNENYLSSTTTEKVKQMVKELGLTIESVHVEMDKNRTKDFIDGRYVDAKGAFYYEGPHMLTILNAILGPHQADGSISRRYEDLVLPDQTLPKQGLAEIAYKTKGISALLFTSMKGDIHTCYSPLKLTSIPKEDTATRYRVVAVKGKIQDNQERTVVGFFEPINGFQRSQAIVVVLDEQKNVISTSETFSDDSMGNHLKKVTEYFVGATNTNPCTADEGLEIVNLLHALAP